jgi:XTP/dITP diphosphohydrolase
VSLSDPYTGTMPTILYAATTNAGKLRDFSTAAEQGGFVIQPLPGLTEIPAPDENETTFAGNARLKAESYSRIAAERGHPVLVLADDSGLEVDALGGEPGVRSARYAADAGYSADGELGIDERNNRCLLERMRDATDRRARYHCVLALARAGATLLTADGSVEGEILTAPRGSGGFGYDPLFFLPELDRTMAEISPEEKHTLSHRGRAFRALIPEVITLMALSQR